MNCEEFRLLLDAYVDGELSQAELEAMNDHAKACEACGEELKAARLLKETLAHLDDDIAVPLPAQAAWRSAIRAEAKKKNTRKWMRVCSAVAAALVLALGVGTVLSRNPVQQPEMVSMARSLDYAETAVVYTDGAGDASGAQVTLRKKLQVQDVAKALKQLENLAQEYSGSFAVQGSDACMITLPGDYLNDFIKAAENIGTEINSETVGEAGETATVLFQLAK